MDLIDKRDEVLRLFLEYGITENTENDLTKTDLAECAEEIVKKLIIGGVSTMLPSINSSTFKNYLEAKGYAETLNPLVYKKQGFEYDKEILHRHFLNEIEFGN
jgi:hypothetical protein